MSNASRLNLWCAAVLLLACGIAPAQTTAPATASTRNTNGNNKHITTQPGGAIMLNFKDASVDTVLDELSAVAGFIVVKEVRPEGTVTLISKQPLKKEDAVSLLNTVLKNAGSGYAAIQQGERILKIVSRDKAKTSNIPVRTGSDPTKIEPTDELITQVIPLRSTDAMQLKNDLAPMISPEASFSANASSNSLIITDTSANIRRIVQIVSAMDASEAGAADYKVIQLVYASASSTAKLINDLFGDAARSGQRGTSSTDTSRFGSFRPPGFGDFPGSSSSSGGSSREGRRDSNQPARAEIKTSASSDDRTNTLVVVGPKDTVTVIEKMVRDLDANPAAESSVFIYHLKNGQAQNVQDVVNYVFNGQPGSAPQRSNTSTGGRTTGGTTGGRSSGFGGLGGGGRLGSSGGGLSSLGGSSGTSGTYSPRSGFGSSGIGGFSGFGGFGGFGGLSSSSMQSAQSLAGQVSVIADIDTNSLLIRTSPHNFESVKTILAELDRPVPQVLIKVLVAEVSHTNTNDFGVELSALNLRASGGGQSAITDFGALPDQITNGGLVARVIETNFEATIRALQRVGKLDVLSRPYILASDNQLASIIVGQVVPIPTNTRVTESGQTIIDTEYVEIGIILNVTPHINPDGLVILDVTPEISSLSGQSIPTGQGIEAPIFNKRSADSRVGILNGKTIVIGGLMEDRKTQVIRKVPLLGDIPGIGLLFQRNQTEKTKTELLIFLTPHVASRPELLSPMSDDEVRGTKLTPGAVSPGTVDEHQRGMQRGATPVVPPATQGEDEIHGVPLTPPRDETAPPSPGPGPSPGPAPAPPAGPSDAKPAPPPPSPPPQ